MLEISAPIPARAEKLGRTLIFAGGGFQIPMFLGMLEAAEQAGQTPHVVIGTCGGASAAVLAHLIHSSEERKLFIESREFFDLLRSIRLTHASVFYAIGKIYQMWATHLYGIDRLPSLFRDTFLSVPTNLSLNKLDDVFKDRGIRAVIVSARLLYRPDLVGEGRNGRKLFQEVFFTDGATGELLRGFPSPVGMSFPESSVLPATDVVLGVAPILAARAGIADPHYLEPVSIDNFYYMTGAIDLYALEVGKQVAKTVFMVFPDGFDTLVQQNATFSAYRYDNNERLRQVTRDYAHRWVDISDQSEIYDRYGFNPRFKHTTLTFVSGLPEDYNEYVQRVRKLWAYGKERLHESLQTPENGKAHIRWMTRRNTSLELRRTLGRKSV